MYSIYIVCIVYKCIENVINIYYMYFVGILFIEDIVEILFMFIDSFVIYVFMLKVFKK